VILLTELCNARCVHCNIWQNRGKEDGPTFDQWKAVLSDLRSWLGPIHVVFTGGEALLRPFTPDLTAYATGLGFFVEVLTHGYWDDLPRMERLALAQPARITMSIDGIGEAHNLVRGRPGFWEKSLRSLALLTSLRERHRLRYTLRLKTVVMSQNLHDVANVARFAAEHDMEVFYQPIEQNYSTVEDHRWWEHSENWPRDTARAVAAVEELIRLKRDGLPIANTFTQLDVMIPYFRDPDAMRVAVQSHTAHERRQTCAALTTLQLQANGEVTVCVGAPRVGNIKNAPIREIWEKRPRYWVSGCCLEKRRSDAEKMTYLGRG
jgi:MoaA/NifB/PqqE/SkfB family radical SAM enzyme